VALAAGGLNLAVIGVQASVLKLQKVKSKVHPRPRHEGSEGGKCIGLLFL
jgi:hypothetical protein